MLILTLYKVLAVLYAYYQNVMHYRAYRGIPIKCDVDTTLFAPFSERRCGRVVKAAVKQCKIAAEFFNSILYHIKRKKNHFQCFELGQQ